MANERLRLGQTGEKKALTYLKKHGYTILETNFRTRFAEIDIIARHKEALCFIEVKTRKTLTKGLPREAVTYHKQQKIIQAALFYLQKNKLVDPKIQFDVVEVIHPDKDCHINLIQNAFQAG